MCDAIKTDIIAAMPGDSTPRLSSDSIMVCCTHTHTGPQTHKSFVGMGHAPEEYFHQVLRAGVVEAFLESMSTMTPATMLHGRTRPLKEIGINRRQRCPIEKVVEEEEEEEGEKEETQKESQKEDTTNKSKDVKWFETAGRTMLGQRSEGPKMDSAEILQFRREGEGEGVGVGAAAAPPLLTLVCYACHPTTVGPELEQSSDFCGALVSSLEFETGGPAMYLNGCCGDVNPFYHRSGYEGAVAMGNKMADAVLRTLRRSTLVADETRGLCYQLSTIPTDDIDVSTELRTISLPSLSQGDVKECRSFRVKQEMWLLSEEEKKNTKEERESLARRTSAPIGMCEYAMKLEATAEATAAAAASGGGGSGGGGGGDGGPPPGTPVPFRIHGISLGPVVLVGMEGEMFCEYQLSLSRSSPFTTSTIVVGYANGCVGYVPTENEVPLGGYECCHSFRVYGRASNLASSAERVVVRESRSLLSSLHARSSSLHQERKKEKKAGRKSKLGAVGLIMAETIDSSFPLAHDTYNAIGVDMMGDYVYYVLSSEAMSGERVGARLYRLPCGATAARATPEELGDLTKVMDDPVGCVVQGKCHVPLIDCGMDLGVVFATHVGFYSFVDGMETLPNTIDLPDGVGCYPGGGVLSYVPHRQEFLLHSRVSSGEGVLTMAVDSQRRRAFYLTWPSGKFGTTRLYRTEDERKQEVGTLSQGREAEGNSEEALRSRTLLDYPGRGEGESQHPSSGLYRCVCRSMVVDPRTGVVYWSNADGDILQYTLDRGVEIAWRGGLRREYFGKYVSSEPGTMAYHWRQVKWYDGSIVGVHGNSGYLFRVHVPHVVGEERREGGEGGEGGEPFWLEMLERLTSTPSRLSGRGDQFSYGYLGLEIDEGRGVVGYLTGAPIFRPGDELEGKYGLLHGEGKITKKGEAKSLEHVHYVEYDLKKKKMRDYGNVLYGNRVGFPTYVNSLAMGRRGSRGWRYAMGRVGEETGEGLTDCFCFYVEEEEE